MLFAIIHRAQSQQERDEDKADRFFFVGSEDENFASKFAAPCALRFQFYSLEEGEATPRSVRGLALT